jgi:hypothetical protein
MYFLMAPIVLISRAKGCVTQCGSSKSRARSSAREFCLRVEKKEKEMLSKILRGAVLATFAVGATVAQADVFTNSSPQTLTWKSFEFDSAGVSVDDSTTPRVPYNGSGGQYYGYYGSTAGTADFFRFFCIELEEYATGSAQYWRTLLNPASDEAKQLSYLFSKYYPNASGGNDWEAFGNDASFGNFKYPAGVPGGVLDNKYAVKSGAMQLAVWEIMFEKNERAGGAGLDLDTGNFQDEKSDSPETAHYFANDWLNDVWTNYQTTAVTNWRFYKFESPNPTGAGGGTHQNYIAARYGAYDVPLPGTLALFGIGLAGLGLARRKS